uniref:Uncharacterized protein n=1 Tax=Picea glauca TaxID=3330 RepID=A0A101LUX2_PICGL|nr:hypothetical protein ABT39_MTgene2359 [Picea glauca]QHR92265.1 hypothetical protein Q903MT_gene6304 [Picea sitchensis]
MGPLPTKGIRGANPSDRTQAGSREPHLSSSHKSKPPSNIIQEECLFSLYHPKTLLPPTTFSYL